MIREFNELNCEDKIDYYELKTFAIYSIVISHIKEIENIYYSQFRKDIIFFSFQI